MERVSPSQIGRDASGVTAVASEASPIKSPRRRRGTGDTPTSGPRIGLRPSFQCVSMPHPGQLTMLRRESDKAAELISTSTWANRSLTKSQQELCMWFNIPPTENMLDEFHCALKKKILLQGRIHVFENHLCFSSNVFGYVTRSTINFSDFATVKKKTHFRLPNSVEITSCDGRKSFFTSFLSRDDAYRLIINCWSQSSGTADGHVSDSQDSASRAEDDNDDSGHHTSHTGSGVANLNVDSATGNASPLSAAPPEHPYRRTRSSGSGMCGFEDDEKEEGADDEGANGDRVWNQVKDSLLPPVQRDGRVIISTVVPGTPKDFFNLVLSDNSGFFYDMLEVAGSRRINISAWKRQEEMGHVRDVQFITPVKGAFKSWGVPHTQCYQSQRLCRYASNQLVYETSQTMTDIPYGDCFTVDVRWDVSVAANTAIMSEEQAKSLSSVTYIGPGPSQKSIQQAEEFVKVELTLRVPFSRNCLFKRVIQSGAHKQVQENYTQLFQTLQEAMHDRLENEGEPSLSASAGGTSNQLGRRGKVMAREGPTSSTPVSPHASLLQQQQQQEQQKQQQLQEQQQKQLKTTPTGSRQLLAPQLSSAISDGSMGKHRAAASQRPGMLPFCLLIFLCLQCYLVWQFQFGGRLSPSAREQQGSGGGGGCVPWSGEQRASGGGGGGGGGAPCSDGASWLMVEQYWGQRLRAQQREIEWLQLRMEAVAGEVTSTLRRLQLDA